MCVCGGEGCRCVCVCMSAFVHACVCICKRRTPEHSESQPLIQPQFINPSWKKTVLIYFSQFLCPNSSHENRTQMYLSMTPDTVTCPALALRQHWALLDESTLSRSGTGSTPRVLLPALGARPQHAPALLDQHVPYSPPIVSRFNAHGNQLHFFFSVYFW